MYAVIQAGGRQYRIAPGEVLRVPHLQGATGETVEFADVLVLGGDSPIIGSPSVAGAKVVGKVVRQGRDKKVISYKFARRKGYEKLRGHRQDYTDILIQDILKG
jgi:large subunit ribosomal protein L21